MKEFFELLLNNPEKAVILALAVIASGLFLHVKNQFVGQLKGFTTKMDLWESSLKLHMGETDRSLKTHSEDMGKATKAINGDMLKIKEEVFELRKTISLDIEMLKSFISEVERNLLKTSENSKIVIQSLARMRSELNTINSKLITIDTEKGKTEVRIAKIQDTLGLASKVIKQNRDDLEKLKASFQYEKRKNEKV
jgi:predicted  nucleic acid-binding Zn-ribbon protein